MYSLTSFMTLLHQCKTLKHGTSRSTISWRLHWYLHLFSPIIVYNYMDKCALLSKCPSYLHITNSPLLSSNIPSSPSSGVFISQLKRYPQTCSSYECFILRTSRLSSKLLKQGYLVERLKSSLRKFNGRYGDLIQQYEVSLSRMLNDILNLDQERQPISWPWYQLNFYRIISGFHGTFATGVAC